MTSCSDGHLFCLECARRNAETTVGNGNYIFKCMDFSGCKAEFTTTETARFVDAKVIALRDKLQSGDALREVNVFFFGLIQASIEGFVTCPFCDYGAILEDENDKEFRCQNKECEKVSCRACRAESHIPLSCEGCSRATLLMRTQKGEQTLCKTCGRGSYVGGAHSSLQQMQKALCQALRVQQNDLLMRKLTMLCVRAEYQRLYTF